MSVQRLQEFLTRKIRVNADLSVLVSLSFGAVAASPGQKADDLKHDAEEALRSAKGNGKGRLVMEFNSDFSAFTGKWGRDNATPSGQWNGKRK